nr:MAG TPA: zinc finger protein [Caudoviricetes sp.]
MIWASPRVDRHGLLHIFPQSTLAHLSGVCKCGGFFAV